MSERDNPSYPLGHGLTMSAPWGRTHYLQCPDHCVDVQGSREALMAAGLLDERARIPEGITGSAWTPLGRVMRMRDGRVRVRIRENFEVVRRNVAFQALLARALTGPTCSEFALPRAPKTQATRRKHESGDEADNLM